MQVHRRRSSLHILIAHHKQVPTPLRAWALFQSQEGRILDYYYEFCGVRFRVSAPLAMRIDKDAAVFETAPASPDVTLTVSPSEQLTPRGEFLARRGEKQVWRDGSTVLRLTKDVFRPEPYLLSSYRLDAPQTVTCHARQEYWQWATRSNYL